MSDFTRRVNFCSDGLDLRAAEYSAILQEIVTQKSIAMDSYSLGGCVEELETKFAEILGKEQAIFMPTGTLANQIAIRVLIGNKSRVFTQKMSHLYSDAGDCVQQLNGVNLVPLGGNHATFSLGEVQKLVELVGSGRVDTGVGVISIETPVRRKYGEMFDVEEMQKIIVYAREKGIKLHLDGARIFIASAYTGIQPAEYASSFDTVYVSLYKYFNAPSGAILAGPAELIDDLFHVRRMYGGGLNQAWLFAAFSLHFFEGFSERFETAVHTSEELKKNIAQIPCFQVENIPNGTNVFKLHVDSALDLIALRQNLEAQNIFLPEPAPSFHGYLLKVNESLNYMSFEELTECFFSSMKHIC